MPHMRHNATEKRMVFRSLHGPHMCSDVLWCCLVLTCASMCSSAGGVEGGLVAFGTVADHIKIMTATASSLAKKPRRPTGRLSGAQRDAVARLARSLRTSGNSSAQGAAVIDPRGDRFDLPETLTDIIARAATLLGEGRRVSVFAEDEMLTTRQAAERLNVSRQYVVRLVDRGDLPSIRVGAHRRIEAKEIAAFKKLRDAKRDTALDRLAAMSEELGGYSIGTTRG